MEITREIMIAIGGKPWQPKQGPERIYLNDWHEMAGLHIERYGSGNVKYAELNGEKISSSKAAQMAHGKVYLANGYLSLEVSSELRAPLLAAIEKKIKELQG